MWLTWFVINVLARVFPSRYRIIPRVPDGVPLLRQFKIFSIGKEVPRGVPPWWHVSLYLQSFVNPEVPEQYHIHRWRYMRSLVLTGGFVEERWAPSGWGPIQHSHAAPSTYSMDDAVIHRVVYVRHDTWTLFLMVGRNRIGLPSGWGYFTRPDMHYTPWDKAVTQPVSPL